MDNIMIFKYQGVAYNCDADNLVNYMKVENNTIGIYQKGVDNPYCIIDRENKTLIVNSEIEPGTFGQGAEATRIKLCAILNCAITTFTSKGWQIKQDALGVIACKESSLDRRRGKQGIDLGAIFA